MLNKAAYTLLELLVCLSIIVVLAAIVGSVVAGARSRSYDAVILSNLRSLGQAGALYAEQHDRYPSSPHQLVKEGLVPKSLCDSPKDRTQQGLANSLYRAYWGVPGSGFSLGYVNYKQSFPSWETYHLVGRHITAITTKSSNAGWLLDFSPGKPRSEHHILIWDGRYRRLLLDTSVITRPFHDFDEASRKGDPAIMKFADFPPEVAEALRQGAYE